ncbi:MAG: fibrobacter succinogenes major paralogous domain-containing protein, partial [Bacteroidales bacterium]
EVRFARCTDPDGKHYGVVELGEQTWMAENLAFLPAVCPSDVGSDTAKCYYVSGYEGTSVSSAKGEPNFKNYGVLYNWPAVMNGESKSNSVPSGVRGICPDGWHLPSDAEWMILEQYLGMSESELSNTGWRNTGTVGKKLKSISGWNNNGGGDNSSGFNVIPAGDRDISGGFTGLGIYTDFWSSSEFNVTLLAWARGFYTRWDGVTRSFITRRYGFSVRCVKNE